MATICGCHNGAQVLGGCLEATVGQCRHYLESLAERLVEAGKLADAHVLIDWLDSADAVTDEMEVDDEDHGNLTEDDILTNEARQIGRVGLGSKRTVELWNAGIL